MCTPMNVNNIVYHCKICRVNVNNKGSAAQCDCNKLNRNDYKYLLGSNDPWYCFSCCSNIFPFRTQTNKDFISSITTTNSFSQITNSSNDKESLLSVKPPSDLALMYNQFNDTSPEKNNDPEKVVNCKVYDIDQIQILKFPDKHKSLA